VIKIKQDKEDVNKIEEPGSLAFLIFPIIGFIFLFSMIFTPWATPEIMALFLIILSPFALLIVYGTLRFYRAEGKKSFLISSNSIQMKLPLKPLEEIKWADFDEISIVVRGSSYKKEHTDVKIRFIGSPEIVKTKKYKFRFQSKSNASQIINLIEVYATVKNVLVKIDKKDMF
jgi:hypothetical protein